MTKDAVEELRLIAPFVEMPSDLARRRQRRKLAGAIEAESASSGEKRSLGSAALLVRAGHPLRDRVNLVGAVAALVAAGVAIPLLLGSNAPTAKTPSVANSAVPVMKLASYRLRLPSSYRLTSAKAAAMTCHVPAGFPTGVAFSSPTSGPASSQALQEQTPSYAPQMAAAANAEGGCVWMALAPPYTPTTANPDPESGTYQNSPPVQVGAYQGRAGTWTAVAKPSNATSQQAALYVEIPLAGGQMQDLAVSSYGLSENALVTLVANGLSVADASPNAGTSNSAR